MPAAGPRIAATDVQLDTNVLVRHLTGTPSDQARRATRFLAEHEGLVLQPLVAAELVYVLESVYEVPRPAVAGLLRAVLAHPPLEVVDHGALLRATELYETTGIHFAEAWLAAKAEQADGRVASFDRALDRVPSITRIEP